MYFISFGKEPINISSKCFSYEYSLLELDKFFKNPIKLSNTWSTFNDNIKSNIPWWSGASYDKTRAITVLKQRNLITLDIDNGTPDTLETIKESLKDVTYFIHSTVRHIPRDNFYKFRVIIPSSKDLANKNDYVNCVNYFMNKIGSKVFDKGASTDVARALFVPSVLKNEEYIYFFNDKKIFTPDFDSSEPLIKLKRLPSSKTNLEGYFCTVYTCMDVMSVYGAKTNDYECDGDPKSQYSRWTYKHGTSKNGIRFEDNGELLHCDHDTCPLSQNQIKLGDKQWSAYDLYVYFEHNGDIKKAEAKIRQDPKVSNLFINKFEELLDTTQSHINICTPVTSREIKALKDSNDATKIKDFVLSRTYKLVGSKVDYIVPQLNDMDNSIDYIKISSGLPCKAFFGNANVLSQDGKKNISIWEIIDKIAPSYTSYKFMPYNPLETFDNDNSMYINTFTGYSAYPLESYKDNETIVKFEHYIKHYICSDDTSLYTWVMDWIADIFQNPANKKGTAIYLYSHEKGVGKSTFYTILSKLLGNLATKLEQSKVAERFNANIASKLLVFIDEATYSLKKSSHILRDNITSETLIIEPKGQEKYKVRDCTRYLIASNFSDAVEFDQHNDERRFTVINMTNRINDDDLRSKYFSDIIKSCSKYKNELLTYLLNIKITSNLTNKYTTDFYKECAIENSKPIDLFIQDILDSDYELLEEKFNTQFENNMIIKNEYIFINKNTLKLLFSDEQSNTSTHIFTKLLSNSRVVIKNNIQFKHDNKLITKINNKATRCIAIPLISFNNLNDYFNF